MSKPLAAKYLLLKECWKLRNSIVRERRVEFCTSLSVHYLVDKIRLSYKLDGNIEYLDIDKNYFNFYSTNKNKNISSNTFELNKEGAIELIIKIFKIKYEKGEKRKKDYRAYIWVLFIGIVGLSQINSGELIFFMVYSCGLLFSSITRNKLYNLPIIILCYLYCKNYLLFFIIISMIDIGSPLFILKYKKIINIGLLITGIISLFIVDINYKILLVSIMYMPYIILKKNLNNTYASIMPVIILYFCVINYNNIWLLPVFLMYKILLDRNEKNLYNNPNF